MELATCLAKLTAWLPTGNFMTWSSVAPQWVHSWNGEWQGQ